MDVKSYTERELVLSFSNGEKVVIKYNKFGEAERAELMRQGCLTLIHRAASGTRSKDETVKERARLQRAQELAQGRVLVDARARIAEEASRQTAIRIAQAMLAQGIDVNTVVSATGLPQSMVERLAQN